MKTRYWNAVIFWSRLVYRVLGHRYTRMERGRYVVDHCSRCLGFEFHEPDCTACEGTSGGVHTCRGRGHVVRVGL